MLTVVVWSLISFSLFAAESEPSWKSATREFITKFAGTNLSHKLLGPPPASENPVLSLPQIPAELKKSTDVDTYSKLKKDPTEYDRLSPQRKRQFDYKFIEELFQVTRKSEAKDEDLSNWLNTLDQGGSREGIYQALVLDDVYAALENVEEKPSKKLKDFYQQYSKKYLNQSFKPESLEQLNLYSLKRIFTEKSLDLMEFYETQDLDALYRWYAIFSADLARDYENLLKNPVREDKSVEYHYEWAKSMPIQHIKSEFIIKLHTVMNGLQSAQ